MEEEEEAEPICDENEIEDDDNGGSAHKCKDAWVLASCNNGAMYAANFSWSCRERTVKTTERGLRVEMRLCMPEKEECEE